MTKSQAEVSFAETSSQVGGSASWARRHSSSGSRLVDLASPVRRRALEELRLRAQRDPDQGGVTKQASCAATTRLPLRPARLSQSGTGTFTVKGHDGTTVTVNVTSTTTYKDQGVTSPSFSQRHHW